MTTQAGSITFGGYSQDEIDAHEAPPTHLTHPQFIRALALARAHNHGWATQLDLLGVDPEHRSEELVDECAACGSLWTSGHAAGTPGCRTPQQARAWERARARKLGLWGGEGERRVTGDELAALRRLESAYVRWDETPNARVVSVEDIRTLTLLGQDPDRDPGITAPFVDADGDSSHETGGGRLEWLIRRDGSAVLNVCRPGAELFRVRVSVRTERGGWWDIDSGPDSDSAWRAKFIAEVRACITATRADRPMPLTEATALIGVDGALTLALGEEGYAVASRLPDDSEPTPEVQALMDQMDLLLTLEPVGRESLTVLSAEVGPEVVTREYRDGTPATKPGHGDVVRRSPLTVTRVDGPDVRLGHVGGGNLGLDQSTGRQPVSLGSLGKWLPCEVAPATTALFLRHVLTLRFALSAIGVEWEPRVEVVL